VYETVHFVYECEQAAQYYPEEAILDLSKAKILIVDDDEDILIAGKMLLKRHFGTIATANKPEHIPTLMDSNKFNVVLLDMNFGVGETSGHQGLTWLTRILDIDPDVVVILITAHSAVDIAVEAMKLGAIDFVEKPWQNERLVATISTAVRLSQSQDEAKSLKRTNRALAADMARSGQEILGGSKAMKDVLSMVKRAAPTDANVLILGENGTGKELIAREIHRQSNRARGVFMSLDMGAISENLFESELFGHKKGAFTDAREDRIGRFQAANGGTLFLDEIGNIPLHLQPKLLTALEQRQVMPVGSNQLIPFDVRIISATNLPTDQLRDQKRFRPDLLYRLNTVEIYLPPLRQRKDDIPILAEAFLGQYGRKYKREHRGISEAALKALGVYDWPGNVRALRHAIERAVILSENNILQETDFSLKSGNADSDGTGGKLGGVEGHTLEEIERNVIEHALKIHQGNISRAARELGLTRTSLYRRMEKYGL
jgi:DNA-binding NtrC family response regulator